MSTEKVDKKTPLKVVKGETKTEGTQTSDATAETPKEESAEETEQPPVEEKVPLTDDEKYLKLFPGVNKKGQPKPTEMGYLTVSPNALYVEKDFNVRINYGSKEEMKWLSDSIAEHGIRLPLTLARKTVKFKGQGEKEILVLTDGHRRMLALQKASKAGLVNIEHFEVPVMFPKKGNGGDKERILDMFLKNETKQLSQVEKAILFQTLHTEQGMSIKDIGESVNLHPGHVSRTIGILREEEKVLEYLTSEVISAGQYMKLQRTVKNNEKARKDNPELPVVTMLGLIEDLLSIEGGTDQEGVKVTLKAMKQAGVSEKTHQDRLSEAHSALSLLYRGDKDAQVPIVREQWKELTPQDVLDVLAAIIKKQSIPEILNIVRETPVEIVPKKVAGKKGETVAGTVTGPGSPLTPKELEKAKTKAVKQAYEKEQKEKLAGTQSEAVTELEKEPSAEDIAAAELLLEGSGEPSFFNDDDLDVE